MTTQCPIVRRLLGHLRTTLKTEHMDELYPDLNVEELEEEEFESAQDGVHATRLRGFIIIEEELSIIRGDYERRYKTALTPNFELHLKTRSWAGLTEVREELDKLTTEIEMELAEALLEGHVWRDDDRTLVIRPSSPDAAEDTMTRSKRLHAAKTLGSLIPCAYSSITTFRPFLGNEEVSVGMLGTDLVNLLFIVYGATVPTKMIDILRRLKDVRL